MTEQTDQAIQQDTKVIRRAPNPITFAQNAVLTIKILLIAAAIIGALVGFLEFTR